MIGGDLSVTDLAFREYCDSLRDGGTGSPDQSCGFVGAELQRKLSQNEVFLRIGAGRPFDPMKENNLKCFLFVTGVYSFPDYRK